MVAAKGGPYMAIISLLKRKGGSGSSTLAANLAGEYAARGQSVKVLDADPQQSLVRWSEDATEGSALRGMVLPAARLETGQFRELLTSANAENDRVIIDAAPGLEGLALTAANSADVILIPVRPSVLDVTQARDALQAAYMVNQTGRIAFVPSANLPRTKLGKILPEQLAAMQVDINGEVKSATVLPGITNRIIIAEAPLDGSIVRELEPDGPATEEFKALAEAVEGLL
jgi:chromosome partitioning protein